MTFCQKTLQPQGPERKIFSIYTNRRKKKLEQQLKNDHQFCNNDHDQEMQSYAKGHGNSSALCSTGTTDLQDGVALSQNTSLNLSINRLQVFRSLYFIDQWREKLTIAQRLKIFKNVSSFNNFANVLQQSYFCLK